jgi:hypothetical protein
MTKSLKFHLTAAGPIGAMLAGAPISTILSTLLQQMTSKVGSSLWTAVNPYAATPTAAADTKKSRTAKRQGALTLADMKRKEAQFNFLETRGGQTIETKTDGAISAMAPYANDMWDTISRTAASLADSGKAFGDEALKVIREGNEAVAKAHANPQLSVYIGNEALDAKFMSVQSSYLSNLGAKALTGD